MKENMFYGASPLIFQRAEELRNNMTAAEEVLWNYLRINEWKLKFRRQHPVSIYVADFYCHALKLVIEVDGGIHEVDEVKRYDESRENNLRSLGLTVLRFKNEEVIQKGEIVLKTIAENITKLRSPLPTGGDGFKSLYIIKIGGNIIDDEVKLSHFLRQFTNLNTPLQGTGAGAGVAKILVHGGGKLATRLADQLGVQQQVIDGRRITDAETLKIVTMVYAGYINKNIVAQLQSLGCNAIGLCGADGNAIQAHKRNHPTINYGYVGDVDSINTGLFKTLLSQDITIVLAPLTHDKQGQLLNTNADTIAQEIANALSTAFNVTLIYSFEKNGVLMNANDDGSVIPTINKASYKELKDKQVIFGGMIPKLDNAFTALNAGVSKVIIGNAGNLQQLVAGASGTTIVNE